MYENLAEKVKSLEQKLAEKEEELAATKKEKENAEQLARSGLSTLFTKYVY